MQRQVVEIHPAGAERHRAPAIHGEGRVPGVNYTCAPTTVTPVHRRRVGAGAAPGGTPRPAARDSLLPSHPATGCRGSRADGATGLGCEVGRRPRPEGMALWPGLSCQWVVRPTSDQVGPRTPEGVRLALAVEQVQRPSDQFQSFESASHSFLGIDLDVRALSRAMKFSQVWDLALLEVAAPRGNARFPQPLTAVTIRKGESGDRPAPRRSSASAAEHLRAPAAAHRGAAPGRGRGADGAAKAGVSGSGRGSCEMAAGWHGGHFWVVAGRVAGIDRKGGRLRVDRSGRLGH
jgi:hypothetical protein